MVISSFVSANTDFTEYRKVTLTDKFSTFKFCSVDTSSLIQPGGRICLTVIYKAKQFTPGKKLTA